MRVIAGIAKGRRLSAPRGDTTRPTTDRVKEALFSILLPRLPDAAVLDLFAGSGALGIEALSRGAGRVTFVERSRVARTAIDDNLAVTGLAERATVLAADAGDVIAATPAGAPFDVVLLDPPYDIDRSWLRTLLQALVAHLSFGAVVVIELGAHDDEPPPWPAELLPEEPRRYGDTVLHVAHLKDRS